MQDSRKIAEEICKIIWTRANDENANAEDDISLVKQTINYERRKVEMLRKAIENEVCYFCQKKVRRYLSESNGI